MAETDYPRFKRFVLMSLSIMILQTQLQNIDLYMHLPKLSDTFKAKQQKGKRNEWRREYYSHPIRAIPINIWTL